MIAIPALPAPGPAVEVRGLTKSFREPAPRTERTRRRWLRRPRRAKLALDNVSLDIVTGDITGVIGVNGSGKSTLIRILSTLTIPDAGEASVFGTDVVRQPLEVRRHINRVSVEAAFFKEMSPWENLSYAARLYGGGGPTTRDRVETVLARLGLPRSALDRPMKGLSRGQQQKVAIARSFLSSPNLLLMDEPTTGLDPRSRREVQRFVTTIREESGATVLLSTHDLHEAEVLCDRVLLLDRGRVIADGTPDELRRQNSPAGEPPASLEDVFLALSGRSLEDDTEDEETET